jgi:hypothetical protein
MDTTTRFDGGTKTETLASEFETSGRIILRSNWLTPGLLQTLKQELAQCEHLAHRNFVPGFKKGAAVSWFDIQKTATATAALYNSPELTQWVSSVVGESVQLCPPSDPHACAYYIYSEPGDHIGYHYDTSHYRGKRFTLLVGIEDQSSCLLKCELNRKSKLGKPVEKRDIKIEPGMAVLFDGDAIYHAVTPLQENERRVILTLEFVTDPSMSALGRFITKIKDGVGYFGLKAVFRGSGKTPVH